MTLRALLLSLCLFLALPLSSIVNGGNACPMAKIGVERLPALNVPRAGHQLFVVNGEPTVSGGHTDGFVPTPTAEYLRDGEWHLLPMVYCHDSGGSVVLGSGKVLLFGGCSDALGIGQTFLAELYDPVTHSFNGFGSMERKRALTSALELDSGRAVIAGNWYHDDGIEMFDGQKRFTYIKDVAANRVCPYILRIARDDAVIFSLLSNRGDTLRHTYVDRLRGDTLHIPLLERWQPTATIIHRDAESAIGDEQKGQYSYLLPVADQSGQVAIARVDNGVFSLLPTVGHIPMRCLGAEIEYGYPVIVDRKARRAYLSGIDRDIHTHHDRAHRLFIVAIDYGEASAEMPAPLTLYYTDPIAAVPDCAPVLTPEGHLLLAGGLRDGSNFTPSSEVWLLRLGPEGASAADGAGPWYWAVAVVALLLTAVAVAFVRHRRRTAAAEQPAGRVPDGEPDAAAPANGSSDEGNALLIGRIRQLMEQERIFQNANLKVTDVSARLGTNNRYVSDCIRQCEGTTFSNFVNGYRIRYAQQLMCANSDTKVSAIYLEAGFANESTFFRTFKAIVGMTPREWMDRHHRQQHNGISM